MGKRQHYRSRPSLFRLGSGVVWLLMALLTLAACNGHEPKPRINKEYPLREPKQLSPPMVGKPIHECAGAVHIYSFIPHAKVEVYANQVEKIGEATPDFAFVDIALTRPLKLGDKITATQTVENMTSDHTVVPVEVEAWSSLLNGLNKPDVGDSLFECGVIVPVGDLVPSVKVHVLEENVEIGKADAPTEWKPVWTQPLHAGKKVTAFQAACEGDPQTELRSPQSDPVTVRPAPNPMPAPVIQTSSLIVGNDAVTLSGLKVGAHVQVRVSGVVVGGGWATDNSNWVPINPPLTATSSVTATQELCAITSPESPPEIPSGTLEAPEVIGPICDGAQHVVVRNTMINANVVLFADGAIVGYSGAVNGDLIITVGGGRKLQAGEKITAIQYMGQTVSPLSNSVTVVRQLEQPFVDVLGGHWFFEAEGTEQQIDGAVFPRGRGAGPIIAIQACCSQGISASVLDFNEQGLADITLTEIFPGYYTGRWPWENRSGWTVPDGIPVGRYGVKVTAECLHQTVTKGFYVIFDPDEVSGPGRFSFNETGVWFGSGYNSDQALLYHLHSDDKRVFDIAIKAAKGQTKQLDAAKKIASAEEALFSYSLNYHTNDVIDMLANYNSAQCADDANVLTALLRAAGIPAHPATADADLETGNAGWNFDTWTELLLPKSGGGAEWLILHPHQLPGDPPRTRSYFGTNVGVAQEASQDLIIMADVNWDWNEANDGSSDVSYKRNDCKKPQQNISKKNWIHELCEDGYWNPGNHWSCGLGSSSSGLTAETETFTGDAGWGRKLRQLLRIKNLKPQLTRARGVIQLVMDRPESKLFPDTIIYTRSADFSLATNATDSMIQEIDLPRSRPAGYDLYVRSLVGDSVVAIRQLQLEDYVKSSLKIDGKLRVGETVRAVATVTNTSKAILNDVRVKLDVPFALSLRSKQLAVLATLQPMESKDFVFELKVVSPIEAGAISLAVETANGGASIAVLPFQIQPTRGEPIERTVFKK